MIQIYYNDSDIKNLLGTDGTPPYLSHRGRLIIVFEFYIPNLPEKNQPTKNGRNTQGVNTVKLDSISSFALSNKITLHEGKNDRSRALDV